MNIQLGRDHKTWSELEVAELIRLRDDELLTFPEIAVILGLRETQCEKRYWFAKRRRLPDSDNPWTADRVERLKTLWADGLSCSQVAAAIGISRNAIIGKVHRLGLSGRAKAAPRSPPKRKRKTEMPKLNRVNRLMRTNAFTGDLRVIETVMSEAPTSKLDPDEIPFEQRKQLLDLNPDDCRWPYGDVGEPNFFFCGAVRVVGCSYCPMHRRLSARRGRGPISSRCARNWQDADIAKPPLPR